MSNIFALNRLILLKMLFKHQTCLHNIDWIYILLKIYLKEYAKWTFILKDFILQLTWTGWLQLHFPNKPSFIILNKYKETSLAHCSKKYL